MKSGEDKKRLFMLIQGLEMGGLEMMTVNLANHLPPRYAVTLCCYDNLGPLAERLSPSIELILAQRKSGFNPCFVFRLARLMRARKTDIVHAHNHTAFFYGTLAAKLAGVKRIVFTEHGRTEKLSRLARLAHRLVAPFVHQTVIVADYLKEMLTRDEGFHPDRILLIQNGIDGAPYQEAAPKSELCHELELDPSSKLVGIVARLDPIKNHPMLLEAMESVVAQEPRARLLIVGDGPEKERLKRQASERNLEGKAVFLGERQDVTRILSSLDLFVLSSISEGMSLTLVEAMAAGLPIVATRVGGNPALIDSGKNGLLVPADRPDAMAAAILELLDNETMARSLAASAKERFEAAYTLERMVGRYLEVYEA